MSHHIAQEPKKSGAPLLLRGVIWIAIGALIAAALVCVVWVLVGDQQGLIGRAFLTIVLLAGFAGIAIAEASAARGRPEWLALTSMITWILALLVGAVKIWLPDDESFYGSSVARFFELLLVVGILQLALLHVRIFWKAAQRYVTVFTRTVVYLTFAFLGLLVALLVFFLTFPHSFHYSELYWRFVVALTILTAVGSTLLPLLNVLFAPKPEHEPVIAPQFAAWPTFADGITPLPVMRDGSPDWNAYYTGVPTPEQAAFPGYPAGPSAFAGALPAAPAAPAPYGVPSASVPPVPAAPVPPAPVAPPAPAVPSATPSAPPVESAPSPAPAPAPAPTPASAPGEGTLDPVVPPVPPLPPMPPAAPPAPSAPSDDQSR